MRIEVLVSTMNQADYSLIDRMNIQTDAIIVNQCGFDEENILCTNGRRITWINSSTRGLSISRNICLGHSTGDICLLADDDLEYVDDYVSIVTNAVEAHGDIDIFRFQVKGIEKKFKDYSENEERVGFLKSLKSSSVELAFRREKTMGLRFDELIGAGTEFCMGEENAFLSQCFKKGLKMMYVPQIISYLHIVDSSWKNISIKKYLLSRGAAFEAMQTPFVHLLIDQFAVRKRGVYNKEFNTIQAILLMEKGRRQYIRLKRASNSQFSRTDRKV